METPLVLQKDKINPTLLKCYQCDISNFINVPYYSLRVEGKMNSAFVISGLKACNKCDSFFMDIDEKEFWYFPKNSWKKKFKNLDELHDAKSKSKFKSLTNKKRGDLRKIKKCEKSHKLQNYDFKCKKCYQDVSIIPL